MSILCFNVVHDPKNNKKCPIKFLHQKKKSDVFNKPCNFRIIVPVGNICLGKIKGDQKSYKGPSRYWRLDQIFKFKYF